MTMNDQRPGSEQGAPQGTVENDFVRPLKPMKTVSHRRLPAALPFAIAGLLVVASVAFGATVIRQSVTPPPNASAVAVGDDNPTDGPSLPPTASPTTVVSDAPPVVVVIPVPNLTLTAALSGTKVKLDWTKFLGDNFGFYKIVRSTGATPSWPLGAGDTLIAATNNIDTLNNLDPAPLGKTFSYEVFVTDPSLAVIVGSNVVSVTTPQPTPTPVPTPTPTPAKTCSLSLSYQLIAPPPPTAAPTPVVTPTPVSSAGTSPAVAQPATHATGYKVKFTWTKYNCNNFQWYGVQKANGGTPTLQIGDVPNAYYVDDINVLTWTDTSVSLGQTYSYRAYAFTEATVGTQGGVQPACYATTILAISNIVTVTIPAS
jgi:hypothetical protein